jgi:hypothetical protein
MTRQHWPLSARTGRSKKSALGCRNPTNAIALDGVLAETLRKECDAWASPTVARVVDLSQTADLTLP